jgi:hypothetical protein
MIPGAQVAVELKWEAENGNQASLVDGSEWN